MISATVSGQNSAAMTLRNTGKASTTLSQKRRLMSMSSLLSSSISTVRGSRAMPHLGQAPGLSLTTSGCMGQVYSVFVVATGTPFGSRAMPHLGQLPGPSCSTSGSMGQVYTAVWADEPLSADAPTPGGARYLSGAA